MRILIIEDNQQLSSLISERLAVRGFSSDIANGLQEADDLLSVGMYDSILLDLGLPDGDGVAWLRSLGSDRPPVVIMTARSTLEDKVSGLDAGADDYIVKPAEAEEIAARLRAVARRPGPRDTTQLEAGPFKFDASCRQFTVNGQLVSVGAREAGMIELLLRNAGRVVPRERIEAAVYGPMEAVTSNALDAIASRLRRRIADAGIENALHTVRGIGYYLEVGQRE